MRVGHSGARAPREGRRRRASRERERPTGETLRSPTVTPKLQRIAAQAARDSARVFPPLASLIDEEVLREAYRHTSKASAPGMDGGTAEG